MMSRRSDLQLALFSVLLGLALGAYVVLVVQAIVHPGNAALGVEVSPQVAPMTDDLAIATHMYRAMLQQCRAARCFGCCPCEANAPPMSVKGP
jgi:hypothetical protein